MSEVRHESRAHAVGNWVMGVIFAASQPRRCDRCKRVVHHLTASQRDAAQDGQLVECRGLLVGRRVCSGVLVRQVAS